MQNNSLQVQTLPLQQIAERRITELSKTEFGEIVLADLLSEELSPEGFKAGETLLKIAYGRDYPKEKFELLFAMCTEDRWSEKRFFDTLRWVIKNNPYPEWKMSEFFTAPLVKLHPRSWMIDQVTKGNKCLPYKVGEEIMYALASDDIPLPTFIAPARSYVAQEAPTCTDEERKEILERMRTEPVKANSIGSHLGDLVERIAEDGTD